MNTWRRGSIYLMIILNAVGIVAYLYFASRVWPSATHVGRPRDLIKWDMTALPLLILAVVGNTTVLVLFIWGTVRRRDWRIALVWILVSLAWLGAMLCDRSRSLDVTNTSAYCVATYPGVLRGCHEGIHAFLS
jgi:hypothetical protein